MPVSPRPALLAVRRGTLLTISGYSIPTGTSTWDRLKKWVPVMIIAPSIIASFVYVFVFAGWTFYISLSDSTLSPEPPGRVM